MARWIPVECTEDLVAEQLIKRPSLEAVGFYRGADGASRTSVGLCALQKPLTMSCPACGFSNPQVCNLQPVSPELTEYSAKNGAALSAKDEVHRKIFGQASRGDVVVVDTVHNELTRFLVDEGLKLY